MTSDKNKGRNASLMMGLALGLVMLGCGSASRSTSTGGQGGDSDTGGSTGSDTGGKTGTGGSTGTGGASTGGATGTGGVTGTGGASTGGSGGGETGGSGGDTGGSGGASVDGGTKMDGGGSSGSHEVTATNALVQCKTTAKYRLPGASAEDFCNFYEKYCPYAPTQPPRLISPPTPATSAYFQDYNDCIMRYTMAPPESQSCRAGQLCGTNYKQQPIGQGCTHATGHFDGPCYATK